MDRVNNTKIALVSGANKGIGHAIAQGLGAIGFRVAVGARDEAGREEAVKRLCAEGADAFGVALGVVRTVLDTNVLGVIRVTNATLPLLGRADSPRIVNMSSTMGSLALRTGPIMAARRAGRPAPVGGDEAAQHIRPRGAIRRPAPEAALERRTNLARRSKCATIEAWQREGAGHSGATRCSPGSRSSIPPSSCSIPAARGR
ncbi:SDR family NAD(P)-dependent oxidoreductase [Streptomyces sp. NEAU-174]|uniref:SDR family NAD(P)-dependent oxidoreductase n=1 Tax=Streptomyces sp. NEAU-174 TaxID=3458254 RepID=UPI00404473B5